MTNRYEITEYKGYSIQIKQTPEDKMTGEKYWTFSFGKNGQLLLPVGKTYGGYEVALAEAKKLIDRQITNQ
ncbi:hypothetical protein HUN01_27905 [Nostoc edaphicum CCNP1411]|uniref:DUF1508 domain-containing protein n=1 Tax=Nostoc edaphicum CCNP1411 TaxID=1472755 RepID=A0A7D7LGR1_9NOSO|nr:hypothetical protein [Nostoc edaphicum]QMS91230.1 hypothetical protein HUN01_27905 [Nostoc edaphicum CCNP1411]